MDVSRREMMLTGAALLAFVKGGSLEDASWIRPALHIWCDSAQPWDVLPEGATCVARNPPAG